MIKLTADQFWARLINSSNLQSGRFYIRRNAGMPGLTHFLAAAVVRGYGEARQTRTAAVVALPAKHHGWRLAGLGRHHGHHLAGLGWCQSLLTPLEVSRQPLPASSGLVVIDELPAHAYHGKLFAGLSEDVQASKSPTGPVILFVLNEDPPPKLLAAWLAESNFEEIEIAGDHD